MPLLSRQYKNTKFYLIPFHLLRVRKMCYDKVTIFLVFVLYYIYISLHFLRYYAIKMSNKRVALEEVSVTSEKKRLKLFLFLLEH